MQSIKCENDYYFCILTLFNFYKIKNIKYKIQNTKMQKMQKCKNAKMQKWLLKILACTINFYFV